MKKNFTQVIFGLAVLLVGALALVNNLGIIRFDDWGMVWMLFLALILAAAGVQAILNRNWFWSIICFSFATSLSLSAFNIVSISFWQIFWPLIIILVGINIIFDFDKKHHAIPTSSKDVKHITAVFWGNESRAKGKFNGSKLAAIFGGIDLDLRDAEISDNAIIDVFIAFGGIDIIAPKDVIIDDQVVGIFGGSETKSNTDNSAKKKITLRGQCIFGGLSVK